jgi:hypothetical protein
MTFVNVSGKEFNTIHLMDERIFEEINNVVQAEPLDGESPELLGYLAAIGIVKGQGLCARRADAVDPGAGRSSRAP